jgi:hypothetical protein
MNAGGFICKREDLVFIRNKQCALGQPLGWAGGFVLLCDAFL